MPTRKHDNGKEALLKEDANDSPRPSLDDDSENEAAALVGREQKAASARAYDKQRSGIFTLRWPGKRVVCLSLLVLTGLLAAIAGSGYFVYQIEPPLGLSPPCRIDAVELDLC